MISISSSLPIMGRGRRSLMLRHHRGHWARLFRSTLPVFVALSLNRVVNKVLDLIVGSSDLSVSTAARFLYASVFAHALGYIVVFVSSPSSSLSKYFMSLATDNSSFAWSSAMAMLILNLVYEANGALAALATWGATVLVAILSLLAMNKIQHYLFGDSPDKRAIIQGFESESFALGIAYSLTMIAAAVLVSDHDDSPVDDDDGFAPRLYGWPFLLYVVTVSGIVGCHELFCRSRPTSRTYSSCPSVDSSYLQSNAVVYGELHDPEWDSDGEGDGDAWEVFEVRFHDSHDDDGRASCCEWARRKCVGLYRECSSLLHTSVGYLVACGWHVCSVLAFEKLFRFRGGRVVGMLSYALLATMMVASAMTCSSLRAQSHNQLSAALVDESESRTGDRHYGQVFSAFGSLLVGWSWQTFFVASIDWALPSSRSESDYALLISAVTAALLVWIGARVELLWVALPIQRS